jgi:hypothetical protein
MLSTMVLWKASSNGNGDFGATSAAMSLGDDASDGMSAPGDRTAHWRESGLDEGWIHSVGGSPADPPESPVPDGIAGGGPRWSD